MELTLALAVDAVDASGHVAIRGDGGDAIGLFVGEARQVELGCIAGAFWAEEGTELLGQTIAAAVVLSLNPIATVSLLRTSTSPPSMEYSIS